MNTKQTTNFKKLSNKEAREQAFKDMREEGCSPGNLFNKQKLIMSANDLCSGLFLSLSNVEF